MSCERETRYLAYMLRLWQVEDEVPPIWRASLENPHTGERQVFPDSDSLFRFLERELGAPGQPRDHEV